MRRIHAFVRILPRRPLQLAARAALALLVVLSAVVSTPSTQAQTLVTLYSFKGAPDGAIPYGGLILESGHLYGTTELGGLSDAGTMFKLDSSGNETVLHSFSGSSGDGAYPFAALIRDPSGNLYSTTYWGGQYGEGTAFKLDQSGAETVLHSFGESAMDGTNPYSDLILDASGHLYGTTQNSLAAGTIFEMDNAGQHEKVLHIFTGGADGASPLAGLIGDAAGYLYGITGYGGDNVCGCGTVFKRRGVQRTPGKPNTCES